MMIVPWRAWPALSFSKAAIGGRAGSMKKTSSLVCLVALSVATIVIAQDKPNVDALEKQSRELAEKRQELREKQIELLKQRLELLKHQTPDSKAVLAMQAILDMQLSKERMRNALSGAKIVADDGAYLGRIGPTYDGESIFCSYGEYGADYSTKSIWCTYGTYGASYNVLSPFCSYSTKPPKIILEETVVASLTVRGYGSPVAISPNALRALFADD